jgi:flagellar biosynthesis protein FliP
MNSEAMKYLSVALSLIVILGTAPHAALGQTKAAAKADESIIPGISLERDQSGGSKRLSLAIEIVIAMTILSLAPAILIMMTCFTRIVVVFSFLRQALGTQQMPPAQLMIGLALFITYAVMFPVFSQVNDSALQPYLNNQIDQKTAIEKGFVPLRSFMLAHTREKDIGLFLKMNNIQGPFTKDNVPGRVLIPAFVISELRMAFQIGFLIYLPFLVIDMVVSSVLMSMGMLMLPPVMVSLPFKILLFVLVDGWYLLVQSLVSGYKV